MCFGGSSSTPKPTPPTRFEYNAKTDSQRQQATSAEANAGSQESYGSSLAAGTQPLGSSMPSSPIGGFNPALNGG